MALLHPSYYARLPDMFQQQFPSQLTCQFENELSMMYMNHQLQENCNEIGIIYRTVIIMDFVYE